MTKGTVKPKMKHNKSKKQPKIDDKKGVFYDKKGLNSDKELLNKKVPLIRDTFLHLLFVFYDDLLIRL